MRGFGVRSCAFGSWAWGPWPRPIMPCLRRAPKQPAKVAALRWCRRLAPRDLKRLPCGAAPAADAKTWRSWRRLPKGAQCLDTAPIARARRLGRSEALQERGLPSAPGQRQRQLAPPEDSSPSKGYVAMNEDRFNMSLRKFLKQVGVTSQREIERIVRDRGLDAGKLKVKVVLTAPGTDLNHVVEGELELG